MVAVTVFETPSITLRSPEASLVTKMRGPFGPAADVAGAPVGDAVGPGACTGPPQARARSAAAARPGLAAITAQPQPHSGPHQARRAHRLDRREAHGVALVEHVFGGEEDLRRPSQAVRGDEVEHREAVERQLVAV